MCSHWKSHLRRSSLSFFHRDPALATKVTATNDVVALADGAGGVFVWGDIAETPLFADGFESGDTSQWNYPEKLQPFGATLGLSRIHSLLSKLEEDMGLDFDFSKLDAMDILDLACFIEREAAESYVQLATWAESHSPAAAGFFRRMAQLESQHDSQLGQRRHELFGDQPSRYSDTAPWEVEVPDLDKVGASFTLEEAYKLALGAEARAEAYFKQAVDYISDPQAIRMLEDLAEEEREHQRFLKEEMAG